MRKIIASLRFLTYSHDRHSDDVRQVDNGEAPDEEIGRTYVEDPDDLNFQQKQQNKQTSGLTWIPA